MDYTFLNRSKPKRSQLLLPKNHKKIYLDNTSSAMKKRLGIRRAHCGYAQTIAPLLDRRAIPELRCIFQEAQECYIRWQVVLYHSIGRCD